MQAGGVAPCTGGEGGLVWVGRVGEVEGAGRGLSVLGRRKALEMRHIQREAATRGPPQAADLTATVVFFIAASTVVAVGLMD